MFLRILLLSALAFPLDASPGRTSLDVGQQSARAKIKDNVAVQLSPEDIDLYRSALPFIAESEQKPMSWAVPVIPYELAFEWGIQSHQVSPIYIDTFGRLLVDQTPVYNRLVGIAEFSHVLELAMDPMQIHQVRGMTEEELRLIADTDIMKFLVKKGVPGAEKFLTNNLMRIERGSENLDPQLHPEVLFPRELLIEYLEQKKASILKKHFEENPYYRSRSGG